MRHGTSEGAHCSGYIRRTPENNGHPLVRHSHHPVEKGCSKHGSAQTGTRGGLLAATETHWNAHTGRETGVQLRPTDGQGGYGNSSGPFAVCD